jgi:hypothetical protein
MGCIPVQSTSTIRPWYMGFTARLAASVFPETASGGASSNADQFSEWQWITVRSQIPAYPF